MPIINEKKIKILEQIEDTIAYKKENNKYWNTKIPTMTCEKELVNKFKQEAKKKELKYTTLMNQILRERYNRKKENNKNEND